jgi:iron complex outermembrane recepter protein
MMDLPGRVELNAALRWVDTLHNNNGGAVGTVPAYTDLNVRIGWHWSRSVDLALIGKNLLHAHHPEYGPPALDREELERSVSAQVIWRY